MWPLEEQSRRKRHVEFGHEAAIGGAQFSVNQVQSGGSSRNRKKRSPRMMPSIRTEGQSRTLSEIQVEVPTLILEHRSQLNTLIFKNSNIANENLQI
jgi:hypothetical protein